jgi:hypothetical protein
MQVQDKSLPKPARKSLPRFTERHALGVGGLEVSPFCLGAVSSAETVCAAFDAGINFFFVSADLHWPAYEATRRGLEMLFGRKRGLREQVVVAGTSYVTQPWFFAGAMRELVEAVRGLERVDAAVVGGAYAWDFTRRLNEYLEVLARGDLSLRAVGASFHDRRTALLATNHNLVNLSMIRYNPAHPGAREDLFPHLAPAHALLFNFKSTNGYVKPESYADLGLDDSFWQPKITDYYRFALTRPEVAGLLCSPSTPAEVEELARALDEGPLEEDEETHLIHLAALRSGRAALAGAGRRD